MTLQRKLSSSTLNGNGEFELLQELKPLLHEKIVQFQQCLASDYIDSRQEQQAQKYAHREIDRYNKIKDIMEKRNEDNKILQLIMNEIRNDIIRYEKLMIIFDRRQDEYKESNVIKRQFLSPRTRFANAWAKEQQMSPRSHKIPEVNFFIIIVMVFFTLLVFHLFTSTLSSTSFYSVSKYHHQILTDNIITRYIWKLKTRFTFVFKIFKLKKNVLKSINRWSDFVLSMFDKYRHHPQSIVKVEL